MKCLNCKEREEGSKGCCGEELNVGRFEDTLIHLKAKLTYASGTPSRISRNHAIYECIKIIDNTLGGSV